MAAYGSSIFCRLTSHSRKPLCARQWQCALEVHGWKPELCLCQRVACRNADVPLLHSRMEHPATGSSVEMPGSTEGVHGWQSDRAPCRCVGSRAAGGSSGAHVAARARGSGTAAAPAAGAGRAGEPDRQSSSAVPHCPHPPLRAAGRPQAAPPRRPQVRRWPFSQLQYCVTFGVIR